MFVNFQHSQSQHVHKAQLLLDAIIERDTHSELIDSIFGSPHDWIACEILALKNNPTLELYSFYQNRLDPEVYSKPVAQCWAAQLLVNKTTLNVVDSLCHEGYGDVVSTIDGSWVVEWQSPDGTLKEYEIVEGRFVDF